MNQSNEKVRRASSNLKSCKKSFKLTNNFITTTGRVQGPKVNPVAKRKVRIMHSLRKKKWVKVKKELPPSQPTTIINYSPAEKGAKT